MTPAHMLFSAAALLPAMTGTLPAAARTITVGLCGGGSISIPVEGPAMPGAPGAPCCAKGCRSEKKRAGLTDRNEDGA